MAHGVALTLGAIDTQRTCAFNKPTRARETTHHPINVFWFFKVGGKQELQQPSRQRIIVVFVSSSIVVIVIV